MGIAFALLSALLFGASTPLAKLLVGQVDPWLLAGLLYLGSGLGLTLVRCLRSQPTAPMAPGEWVWLAGAILCGGILAPVLLMWGLSRTPGSTASLLLNAEGVMTALLAWFAFHENFDRRIALGMVAIIAGTVVLSWSGQADWQNVQGPLAIVGACLCWGLDNNLTRKVSLSDPVQIAGLKGLVAGLVNCALALVIIRSPLPSAASVTGAALVGFLGYGVSLVLFVLGLRHLGTARAGAYFSTAPFVGAAAAVLFMGEPVTLRLCGAAALMAWGIWLHLTEHHEHDHDHTVMEHDHSHSHDDHHAHPHDPPVEGEHSHWHRHEALRHRHSHYPDSHHRHSH